MTNFGGLATAAHEAPPRQRFCQHLIIGMHWCKWPLLNSCCWLVLAFPLTCLFEMTTPRQTITHKHCSYSILKQLCRIQLVLGGARTVGLLALELVLILALALHSVHVQCKLCTLPLYLHLHLASWHFYLH